MKILTIPLLAHDASICILEDGKITSYQMEERFSRNKHDLNFDCILNNLKDTFFDKIIITQHFLENYTYSLEKVKEKIQNLSYKELIVEKERHHLYHAYSGFYNSGFEEAICFSVDASGAILSNDEIEIDYYVRYENLLEDLEKIGIDSIQKLNSSKIEDDSIIQLTKKSKNMLYEIYDIDYQNFSYSKDSVNIFSYQ